MKPYFIYLTLFCIILTFGGYSAEAYGLEESEKISDYVLLLKGGVEILGMSIEISDHSYSNQMHSLKKLQHKLDSNYFGVPDKIGSHLNDTFQIYKLSENVIVNKLKELQDDQTTRLDTIISEENKKCDTSATLTLISASVDDLNKNNNNFDELLKKLQSLKEKFILQHTKMEANYLDNLIALQEISDKLTKNQEQFEKIEKDLPNLSELSDKIKNLSQKKYSKLPMPFIMGLTTANMTKI